MIAKLLFYVFSVITIFSLVYRIFYLKRSEKGLINSQKLAVNDIIFIIVFLLSALITLITFCVSFSIMNIIIMALALIIDTCLCIYICRLKPKRFYLFDDDIKTEDDWVYLSVIFAVVIVAVASLAILFTYIFFEPAIYELVSQKEIMSNEILTEDISKIVSKDESLNISDQSYFIVVKDASDPNKYRYYFYAKDYDGVNSGMIKLDAGYANINILPSGEKPYYQKIQKNYVGKEDSDKLLKKKDKKIVYNVFIPEEDILYIEKDASESTTVS